MKLRKLFLFGLLGGVFLNSCSSDDDNINPQPEPETGSYAEGFFVLNEGQNLGSVTFVSDDFQTVEQDIYAAVNDGDDIGKWAQSIFFTDELAFIIGGGSNIITVVDRYSFELVGKVETGLQAPRYGAVIDGKAYVTNHAGWESVEDDYLVIIDVETLQIEDSIVVGDAAETVIAENGLLYIQNAAYGSGNSVSVFNPATKAVEKTIETKEGLSDFEIYKGNLYALSSAGLQVRNINSGELISEISFSDDLAGASKLDVEDDKIYYTVEGDVFAVGLDATEPAEAAVISSNSANLYGFDVEDDHIYLADAPSFSESGMVRIYTFTGQLVAELSVGIGPNGFYFND
ncbi:DUF5074 domain-containing protein [Salinimicrobium sp. TIG7-5_MAKvit]|uniref:YncE family protein n=1 Tax=Salinimicrobium sp. TIG7-5_MAKvit TaxID=3121289 RepID=UPI003C6E185E